MRANVMIDKLRRDEPVFGPMIMDLSGPGLPQIVANAGADFIVYDMEAGCLDMATIKTQLALVRGTGLAPIVNTAWHDYAMLARPLDSGAMGLMVPVVQTPDEAREIVRISRYTPRGGRGVAFGIAHDDYSMAPIAERMRLADARTIIMPKIETALGVENIEAIMAVDGIDAAYVGHMDLSVSLGIPGDYMHPKFAAAVDRIIDACRTRGKHVSCMAANPEAARVWIAKGVRIILYGTDVILLGGALRSGIEASRGKP
ncbi:MAG: HpcH/HpaI aldolase family protein [Rhodospirillales bacterium]|jgi:2-keto-3-deoxy-L-rhamnonate aldolase RhmA